MILCIGCLAACNNGNGGTDSNDPADLQTDIYTITTQIKFATDDPALKDAVNVMNSTMTTNVNHDDVMVSVDAGTESASVNNEYILVGGVLYHAYTVKVGEYSVSTCKKATFGDGEKDSVISKAGGAKIGIASFLTQELSTGSKTETYTCSEITDEARAELESLYSARLASIGASVTVDSAEYVLEFVDGRETSSTLSVSFIVTIDGQNHTLIMRQYASYDYENQQQIAAPENAESYTEVSAEDIIG